MPTPGKITVVEGPMGSGKTVYLIRYIETHGRHSPVLFINHSIDNRSGEDAPWSSRSVLANSGSDFPSKLNASYVKVAKLAEVPKEVLDKHSMVIVDESQFFPDLVEEVKRYAEELGKDVVAAGLLTDFKREPFGHLLKLLALADKHHKLKESLCDDCLEEGRKSEALFSRRVTGGDHQVEVGKDQYRGVCRECWLKHSK